jgi:hypothetical protein
VLNKVRKFDVLKNRFSQLVLSDNLQ